ALDRQRAAAGDADDVGRVIAADQLDVARPGVVAAHVDERAHRVGVGAAAEADAGLAQAEVLGHGDVVEHLERRALLHLHVAGGRIAQGRVVADLHDALVDVGDALVGVGPGQDQGAVAEFLDAALAGDDARDVGGTGAVHGQRTGAEDGGGADEGGRVDAAG